MIEQTFKNIKTYTDFMENRIMTEINENPEQYDKDIDFWCNQYDEIEENLRKIVDKLCINVHPGHYIFGGNMVYVFIRLIEEKRNGMISFEEFLNLIRAEKWGEINQEWYGYYINCFNSTIAIKCMDVAEKDNKFAPIRRQYKKIHILDFDMLNSYLKGYVGDRIEKTKNDCIHIPEKALDEFNEYSNDFSITYHGYYIIRNIAKDRENRKKQKEIDEIIDFLF